MAQLTPEEEALLLRYVELDEIFSNPPVPPGTYQEMEKLLPQVVPLIERVFADAIKKSKHEVTDLERRVIAMRARHHLGI